MLKITNALTFLFVGISFLGGSLFYIRFHLILQVLFTFLFVGTSVLGERLVKIQFLYLKVGTAHKSMLYWCFLRVSTSRNESSKSSVKKLRPELSTRPLSNRAESSSIFWNSFSSSLLLSCQIGNSWAAITSRQLHIR